VLMVGIETEYAKDFLLGDQRYSQI
jgi:hypothetical protein